MSPLMRGAVVLTALALAGLVWLVRTRDVTIDEAEDQEEVLGIG